MPETVTPANLLGQHQIWPLAHNVQALVATAIFGRYALPNRIYWILIAVQVVGRALWPPSVDTLANSPLSICSLLNRWPYILCPNWAYAVWMQCLCPCSVPCPWTCLPVSMWNRRHILVSIWTAYFFRHRQMPIYRQVTVSPDPKHENRLERVLLFS